MLPCAWRVQARFFCNAMPWVDCTALRYHCTRLPDVDLCPQAYAEGRFPPGCTAKDFIRMEPGTKLPVRARCFDPCPLLPPCSAYVCIHSSCKGLGASQVSAVM